MLATEYIPKGNTMLHSPAEEVLGTRWMKCRQAPARTKEGMSQVAKAHSSAEELLTSRRVASRIGVDSSSSSREPATIEIARAPIVTQYGASRSSGPNLCSSTRKPT